MGGQLVRTHCDNEAVVHIMASRTSKNPELMHLLRCIYFIEASLGFSLSVRHISGVAIITELMIYTVINSNPFSRRYRTRNPFQPPYRPAYSSSSWRKRGRGLRPTGHGGSVRSYCSLGLAPSTNKVYNAAVKRFSAFCVKYIKIIFFVHSL